MASLRSANYNYSKKIVRFPYQPIKFIHRKKTSFHKEGREKCCFQCLPTQKKRPFIKKLQRINKYKLSCMHAQHNSHFGKYHNTLCLSPPILHKHCFQFLLALTMVPRESKNSDYAKCGGTNKEYYCIFRNGLLRSCT